MNKSQTNTGEDVKREIQQIAPVLSSLEKRIPEVPQDYFDTLPYQIQSVCVEKEKIYFSDLIFNIIKPSYLIPAGISCFIAIVGIIFIYIHKTDKEKFDLATVSQDEVYSALVSMDADELDDAMLYHNTEDVNLSGDSISAEDNSIIDYLIENDIDAAVIEKQLYL